MPFPHAADPHLPVFSGGPCPGCDRRGVLLILRRSGDGALLFHCPTCGLSFTHVGEDEDPEYARSLDELAPRGAEPATEGEIRRVGLWEHALPWRGGTHGSEPVAKPVPSLRAGKTKSTPAKKPGFFGSALVIFIVIKLLVQLFRHFDK